MPAAQFVDLYEILQVSPKAEKDTIKRVHQMLSLKYQLAAPENNAVAYFAQLQQAAATLLDPVTRAAYDAERETQIGAVAAATVAAVPVAAAAAPSSSPAAALPAAPAAEPKFPDQTESADPEAPPAKPALDPNRFMDGLDIQEEKRRRAALVEICYRQRILKPRLPALSMKQLEDGLALNVSELEGPLWFLKETDMIRVSDAGNYSVSVRGMNAIEAGHINLANCIFDINKFGT